MRNILITLKYSIIKDGLINLLKRIVGINLSCLFHFLLVGETASGNTLL